MRRLFDNPSLLLLTAALASVGCLVPPAGRIDVPPDVLRGPNRGEAGAPRSRYVVRMTDGDQDWEFQLPEIATAYEVRIPLRGRPGLPGGPGGAELAAVTAADKEIARAHEAEENARADSQVGDEGDEEGKKAPRPRTGPTPSPRSSYLLTLAKVKDLYKTRNYEVALVELTSLERDYPNDERILSMKGSLYEKLGKKQLARDTWQTVLSINPYNLQVVEALQRLGK
jgi:tetratricopeptide (TPR) repeat protein